MLKGVVTTHNGTKVLVLGLSKQNVDRLKAGQPILIELEEMYLRFATPTDGPVPSRIGIYYGDDMDSLRQGFQEAVAEAELEGAVKN
jgi:hypothetical protein